MSDTDKNGTLDFPCAGAPWGGGSRGTHRDDEKPGLGSSPTFMIKKDEHESGQRGDVCPKCGAACGQDTGFCSNCGATITRKAIVDMRHTLDGRPARVWNSATSGGVEVQRMKTSYKSGVLGARTEMEGISPVPTPVFPPAQQLKKSKDEEGSKYTVILAVTIIAFITIMIVVLIILIAGYL